MFNSSTTSSLSFATAIKVPGYGCLDQIEPVPRTGCQLAGHYMLNDTISVTFFHLQVMLEVYLTLEADSEARILLLQVMHTFVQNGGSLNESPILIC
ncbi:hypothetical protein COP2_030223 [Malus domestica]